MASSWVAIIDLGSIVVDWYEVQKLYLFASPMALSPVARNEKEYISTLLGSFSFALLSLNRMTGWPVYESGGQSVRVSQLSDCHPDRSVGKLTDSHGPAQRGTSHSCIQSLD